MTLALVTGASSGIGKSIALALAARGFELVLSGRDEARLDEVANLAKAQGGAARAAPADLTRPGAIEALAAGIDRLDVLVHAAGVARLGTIAHAPIEDLDLQWAVNVRTPIALTRALDGAIRRAQGQVVLINSGAGLTARAGWGHYAATKFALRAFADSLREEVKAEGVRVLSVFPGRTATPMQEEVHRMEGREYRPERFIQPEAVAAMVIQAIELPRTAHVIEINIRHPE
jgi:short-subunit dehydrogenase